MKFCCFSKVNIFKDPFLNIKTYANPIRPKKDRYRVTLIYKQQHTNSVTNTPVVVCFLKYATRFIVSHASLPLQTTGFSYNTFGSLTRIQDKKICLDVLVPCAVYPLS